MKIKHMFIIIRHQKELAIDNKDCKHSFYSVLQMRTTATSIMHPSALLELDLHHVYQNANSNINQLSS